MNNSCVPVRKCPQGVHHYVRPGMLDPRPRNRSGPSYCKYCGDLFPYTPQKQKEKGGGANPTVYSEESNPLRYDYDRR